MPDDLIRLKRLTELLLSPQSPASALFQEVKELSAMFAGPQEDCHKRHEDISNGETRTAHGLALSSTMAAMCADDFVRTIEFLRGTHAAIVDLRQQLTDRPVRVLYVGCGPYATLAVPLMAVLDSTEASFTLLDIHSESIDSARSIVDRFGLADSIASYETVDAASYRVRPDEPPDLILIEIMQACLEAEPQVAITRHLLNQAPNAVLLPEEVRVDLILVNRAREFNVGGVNAGTGPIQRDRIPAASVFVVNRETVKSWDKNCNEQIAASTICMPDSSGQQYQPMLFTQIQVYQNHRLRDYDSGLTCPRSLLVEGTITPGATIQFTYELGSHPRLKGTVINPADVE